MAHPRKLYRSQASFAPPRGSLVLGEIDAHTSSRHVRNSISMPSSYMFDCLGKHFPGHFRQPQDAHGWSDSIDTRR